MTVHRCLATLSSTLGDAVRQHRLPHNPARPAALPRPPTAERRIWTAEEATRFLRYCLWVPEIVSPEVTCGFGSTRAQEVGGRCTA